MNRPTNLLLSAQPSQKPVAASERHHFFEKDDFSSESRTPEAEYVAAAMKNSIIGSSRINRDSVRSDDSAVIFGG